MSDLTEFYDESIKPGMHTVLPAGEYIAHAVSIDVATPRKDPNGKMLVVTYRILHGDYCGRQLKEWLNLRNMNPEAERHAKKQLATFSHAVLGRAATNTNELLLRPLVLTVVVRTDQKYGESNKIMDYQRLPPGTKLDARLAAMPGTDAERAAAESEQPLPIDAPDESPVVAPANLTDAAEANRIAGLRASMRTSRQVSPSDPPTGRVVDGTQSEPENEPPVA